MWALVADNKFFCFYHVGEYYVRERRKKITDGFENSNARLWMVIINSQQSKKYFVCNCSSLIATLVR